MQWEYKLKDETFGPVSLEELKHLYSRSDISNDTRVREAGSSIWQRLDTSDAREALGITSNTVLDADGKAMKTDPEKVKPLGWRYYFFMITAAAFCFSGALVVLGNMFFAVQLMQGGSPSQIFSAGGAQVILSVIGTASHFFYVFLILSGIAYGFLFHQAMRNVRLLGATETTIRPFMVWLWHFVPFASLIMPAQAISQIRNASLRLAGQATSGGAIIVIWWTAWLLSVFGSRIISIIFENANPEPEDLAGIFITESVVIVFFEVSAVCIMLIARRVNRLQKNLNMHSMVTAFD